MLALATNGFSLNINHVFTFSKRFWSDKVTRVYSPVFAKWIQSWLMLLCG